jgi:hypothetical protein
VAGQIGVEQQHRKQLSTDIGPQKCNVTEPSHKGQIDHYGEGGEVYLWIRKTPFT